MTITPSTEDLHDAVRALVATGSGLPRPSVIPGDEGGPFPELPCATVTPISDVPEGFPWSRNTRIDMRTYTDPDFTDGATIDSQAFQSTELSYSVQWFGTGAADYARRFALWAGSPAGTSEIARRGLTFYRTGPSRHLSALERDEWEERRGLDLFLGAVFTDTRDVGIIESTDVSIFPDEFSDRTPNEDRIETTIPTAKQETENA